MQLGLTIPLQRHLKIKSPPYGAPLDMRFCWDLHVITLHGRKSLLAVHCASRCTFTLFDLANIDWNELPETFLQGLRRNFTAVGISEKQTDSYLYRAGAPELTKTHGRREVAFLNRVWDDVAALDYTVNQTTQFQPLLDGAVNRLTRRCAGYDGLGLAIERLHLSLAEME